MSPVLRLFVTADWPAQDAACDWVLVGADDKQAQRGRSEPRHWPVAPECELVLGAEQCLLLRTSLPKGAKSRLPEVISYALEDHLIGDAESDHFVAGDSGADGLTAVWVISRARLKVLQATLDTVGRRPWRAYCEIQLLPLQSGCWSVCLREQSGNEEGAGAGQVCGFARTGPEDGFSFFDVGDKSEIGQPPLELNLALQAAQASSTAPGSITLYVVAGISEESAREAAVSWQAALGVPVAYGGEYIWHEHTAAAGTARNLLTGEFAPPRRPQDGWGSFRPALFLALAAGIVFTLFSIGEWAWLRHRGSQLQQQMVVTFRNAFPQSQTLVNPPLQMQRLYDQLRREQGQLGATDFLPMLSEASETMVGLGTIHKVGYEEGRLEVTLGLASAKTAERIYEIMKSRGLAVTLHDTRPATAGGQGVEATFSLRGTP